MPRRAGGAPARRAEEDPEVETERPAAGIRDVHVERLGERRPGPRRHLPEPGDARRDEEPLELMRLEELGLVREARTWADERHVAAQDVQELRQLVQARRRSQRPLRRDDVVALELVHAVPGRARAGS